MNNGKDVSILDYGIGNLLSVRRGVEKCGYNPILVNSNSQIQNSEKLILPGVGAFRDGINLLKQKGFIEGILEFTKKGSPLLGICLGMQMLFDTSDEHGMSDGLGLIPGKVVRIPNTSKNGNLHKIPHISWNKLLKPNNDTLWRNTILANTEVGSNVYFVHSFHAIPSYEDHLLSTTDYNGRSLAGVVKKDNIYGCQFHPEKSGTIGLTILKNFCELVHE